MLSFVVVFCCLMLSHVVFCCLVLSHVVVFVVVSHVVSCCLLIARIVVASKLPHVFVVVSCCLVFLMLCGPACNVMVVSFSRFSFRERDWLFGVVLALSCALAWKLDAAYCSFISSPCSLAMLR